MSSSTPAGTASTQPSNNSGVANPASSESNYNMNATPVEPARTADDNWAQVQNEIGTEAEVRERVELDDAAFEEQTKMVGASDPGTKEEDKSLLQKGIDAIAGVNKEAGKEYLAS